ncbi:CPBP family intramembrane glutamic endopeptidase, partial [Lactobacillus psittaci]
VNRLTSLWTRLGYILLITFILLAIPPVTYHGMNAVENTIFNLSNGFLALLLLSLALKSWNYTWRPNLPIGKNKPYQILGGVIILFYMLWFPLFNSLIRSALTWSEVFGNWGYALSQLNFELVYVGYALSTGLIEESFRYGFMLLLLSSFKTRPLAKAIIISSATFALLHFTNLSLGWDFISAAYQVVGAFGISLAIVTIYLYTGKLYLAIAMHTLIDLMGYMLYLTPNLLSSYAGFLNGFSIILLKMVVNILFFIFFMTGKRRQVIKQNAKEMITLKN